MPRDPVHARGVRRRSAADRGRGWRAHPHPRAQARRDAQLRDRGLPGDLRRDPRRGRRRGDHQLLHRGDGRQRREAHRLPARGHARGRRAEHGVDELREVLRAPQELRLQRGLRQPVRRDHRVPHGDERAGHQARARVLRRRPCRLARAADRHGRPRAAAARGLRHGRDRRRAADGAQPRRDGRQPARGRRRALGRDRHLARAVADGRRRPDARRVDPRRPRGQLLPARRRDGALQRRADRQGAAADDRRRPAAGHRRGGARAARRPGEGRGVTLPLEGVKVLDLSRLLPGGFCSLLLADFGADVIKVEDTGMGDYVRWSPPYYEGADDTAKGALFLALNRNKRSIRVDLKADAGREVLLRLVREADVLIDGFRPGVLERLGVGHDTLRDANRGLVICAITGYGQDGPLRDRSGHDMNYLGLIGLLGLTGETGGPPIQAAGQIADIGGGALMAAFGIMTALRHRDRTGEGQVVDIAMADGALSWLAMVAARYFAEGRAPRRGELELSGSLVCYRPYQCADGWVTLGALEPKFWQAWCRGVGREDLIEQQFQGPGTPAHVEVQSIFMERTRDEWQEFAGEHDCCLEPVLDLDEALASELVGARGMVVEHDQPGATERVRLLGIPIKLSQTPGDTGQRPGPALGEHTAEILAAAGYAAEEIAALEESGAVAGPAAGARGSFLA